MKLIYIAALLCTVLGACATEHTETHYVAARDAGEGGSATTVTRDPEIEYTDGGMVGGSGVSSGSGRNR